MIIYIDTSNSGQTTVELKDKNGKLVEKMTIERLPGSQALLPAIVKTLKKHKLKPKDLSAVEVNQGPGSYTGLRVGVSVANTLGHFLKIPVNKIKGRIIVPKYE